MSRRSRGFSLIELMVAMVLGLIIVSGVISVMLANKRSYRTNLGLSQIQESGRTAFEMLARDLRQTGGTGCDNARRMATAFSTGTQWWKTWATVQGFDGAQTDSAVATGSTVGQRVAGTDSIHLHSVDGGGFSVAVHDSAARTIQINNASTTSFSANEQLIICDFDHSTMFRATTYTGGTSTLAYSLSGNCSTGLGYPTNCDGSTGNVYAFPANSWVGRLSAVDWYIGNNGRPEDGGRSLYRVRLGAGGTLVTEEVVAGITDMQITYGSIGSDAITSASAMAAAAWTNVNSVFITLTLTSTDTNVSSDMATNSGRITRNYTYLITLRNRVT